jgi:hypothetical protein
VSKGAIPPATRLSLLQQPPVMIERTMHISLPSMADSYMPLPIDLCSKYNLIYQIMVKLSEFGAVVESIGCS